MSDFDSTHIWTEINLTKIQNNFKKISEIVRKAKCFPVLKANAYGNGDCEVASALYDINVRDFLVSYLEEALRIRNSLLQNKMSSAKYHKESSSDYKLYLLDGPLLQNWPPVLYSMKLIPVLSSIRNVISWNDFAKGIKEKLPAVLFIDSGLRRLGIPFESLNELKKIDMSYIEIDYIISHPADSRFSKNNLSKEFQLNNLIKIMEAFPNSKISYSDSTSVGNFRELDFDIVRVGSSLYSGVGFNCIKLEEAVTIYAKILQIETVRSNSGVGYQWETYTKKETKIAIIACGYSDGMFRKLGVERGFVLVNGMKAKILGKISMDLTIIDITKIPNVFEGDVVTIISENKILTEELINGSDVSFYELLACRGERVVRKYIRN